MLTTSLSERFGLTLPVVSAGMAFVAGPRPAAAVSNAGGLGVVGGAMAPPGGLAGLVAATRGLTSRPFGVDLVTPFVEDGHIAVLAQVRPAAAILEAFRREAADALHRLAGRSPRTVAA